MAFLPLKSPLSTEDRIERRRLILSDTLSLTILVIITLLLALVTNRLYQSYASHQAKLMDRWRSRGETDLNRNDPEAAITDLRSALAYSPGDGKIEIELATALALAGRTQEATVYFNTLLESEPGNGMINLQLARLNARQNNLQAALDFYHRAIYGTWEGDGYVRRREVRMELIDYLISHGVYDEARNELLVAEGNSPEEDIPFQLKVAQEMEQAHATIDALRLYHKILFREPASVEAMLGFGRTAFQLGRYAEARVFLDRAVNQPAIQNQPAAVVQHTRDLLRESSRLMLLYPSLQLRAAARSTRILEDRKIALARLSACTAKEAPPGTSSQGGNSPPAAGTASGSNSSESNPLRPLENFASRFGHHVAKPTGAAAPPAPQAADALKDIASRWAQQPATLTLSRLKNDPDLAQATVRLIYDTELVTAQVCGLPTGDDALLLKIAQAPDAVEQE